MDIKLPAEVKNILDKFQKKNFQIFTVGGSVRDLLMGKKVSDWDFTTDATPEEILKVLPEGFLNNKFGTVGVPPSSTVYSLPSSETAEVGKRKSESGIYEITTMRKEGIYKDHRHPEEVSWTNKIEEDLARRDFTINALALSAKNGIIDPFNGQEDLKNKIIKAVGDPNKRFQEDALRLMRAIRIAAELEFEIDLATFQAIFENAHLLNKIASERIRDELFKILISDNAYEGIIKLKECGLLEIILPELMKCFGIVQEGPKHARMYDIGIHCLLTLKHTPSIDPVVRFASLLHDIGKAITVKTEADGNVTFYNHDVVGSTLVLKIAKRFNLSKKQTDKLFRLIRFHMFTVDENQTDSAIRRFIKNAGMENLEDMFALRIGDRLGGGTQTETSWRMEKFKERIKEVLKKPFTVADLKINGQDVMKILNIKPGPKVGQILQKLFEEVLEDASKNNREYLLTRIKNLES